MTQTPPPQDEPTPTGTPETWARPSDPQAGAPSTGATQPGQGEGWTGAPAQPGYDQTAPWPGEQPAQPGPEQPQTGYPQGGYGQGGYEQGAYGQTGYAPAGYGQPATGPGAYGHPGYGPTGGYPAQGYPTGPVPPANPAPASTIVLLVLSGLAVLSGVFILVGIVSLILSIIALTQHRQNPDNAKRLTRIGWTVFWVVVGLHVLALVAFIAFFATVGTASATLG